MCTSDFLWGVSTSAYQIEGSVAGDGRGESIWDPFAAIPGNILDMSNASRACEHSLRYREDVRLLQEIGVDAYRFSIGWSRVLPKGFGKINQPGLDFYHRLVDELLAANIVPVITLYHWDLPQALQERGGWRTRETLKAFTEFSHLMVRELGDRVKIWITHNEMWTTAFLGHYNTMFSRGYPDFAQALQAAHHVLLSHGMAVPIMREELGGDAKIGVAQNVAYAYPASDSQSDAEAAQRYDGFFNRWFLDPLAGCGYPEDMWDCYKGYTPHVAEGDLEIIAAPIDFLGINYYNADQIRDYAGGEPPFTRGVPDPSRRRTADREIYAQGLYEVLLRLHQDYAFPELYITENGAAFEDTVSDGGQIYDKDRIEFLDNHIEQAVRAIESGVTLKGFFVRSFLDCFEWAQGYSARYGLVYVDFDTQKRTLKESAKWYRRFIEESRA